MIHVKVINGHFVTCWPMPPPTPDQRTWPQVASERYLRLGDKTRKKAAERVAQSVRMDVVKDPASQSPSEKRHVQYERQKERMASV